MGLWVDKVIRNPVMAIMTIMTVITVMTMMTVMMPDIDIEIVQDEEPREEESRAPEWIRDPGVEVVVIPGRWVISDDRRTFLIVVVVDDRGLNVLATCWRLTLCVLVRSGHNS